MKKNSIMLLVVFMAFTYGVLVGKKEIFPYKYLQYLENTFIDQPFIKQAYSNPIDNPKLPNVLIIGDSISIGYTSDVREELKTVADVYRIQESGVNTEYGKKKLKAWLGDIKWDVIHFNWGLHDIKCGETHMTESQYKQNLEEIINILKNTQAKLIWASTTPVPPKSSGRKQTDEIKYNEIARQVMLQQGIVINDLYSYALLKISDIQHPNDVHFTTAGYHYLSEKVSNVISKQL